MPEPTSTSSSTGLTLSNPVVLLIGVLLVQLAFIASYVGAFHSPTPRDVPVAVVAPAGAPGELARETARSLNALDGHPIEATARQGRGGGP